MLGPDVITLDVGALVVAATDDVLVEWDPEGLESESVDVRLNAVEPVAGGGTSSVSATCSAPASAGSFQLLRPVVERVLDGIITGRLTLQTQASSVVTVGSVQVSLIATNEIGVEFSVE